MKPFFSIILPTFNQANFLKKSLNSIIQQTFKNWELIIIDNYSTDETKKVIQSFKDKRFRVFKIKNKNILARSRNLGIKKSKSDWICFIDSDDKWYPKKLEITKNFIEKTKGDLFYHDLVFTNKYFIFKRKKIHDKSKTMSSPILNYFTKNGNGIGQSSVTVRKKILNKIGLISEKKDKFSWEDFDTWIRISKITQKFIRIPKVLGSIYVGKENISTIDKQIENANNINKYYRKSFNKFLDKKDHKKKLWWLEYPSILKNFRERDSINFFMRISSITKPPVKIYLFINLMKIILKLVKIFRKFITCLNIIILFKYSHNKKKYRINKKIHYNVIKNINDLNKIKFNNFKIPTYFIDRIKNKNQFHFISKSNDLLSCGWSSNSRKFFVSEIENYLDNKDGIIFFDFVTLEAFQNKGYYKSLLCLMLGNFRSKNCFIYSLSSNKKSISAILSTGFIIMKKLSFFQKNSFTKIN